MTIGDRIRRLRQSRTLLQRDLAALAGVAQQTVSDWERGRGEPRATELAALARVLGVDPAELLGVRRVAEKVTP